MGARLVVFGGGGFVGGHLCAAALRQGREVHAAGRGRPPGSLPGAQWHTLEVTDPAAVRCLLQELAPQAVVDAAAVADIDRAERERELAWAVNVEAARGMASACAACGASFLYLSSDAVFAGTAAGYSEEDAPSPVNYYGRTKAEGEKAVLQANPRSAVARLSLVLGFPLAGGNSFLAALEARLRAGQEVAAPADEIRTPVDVLTLSECLLELSGLRFAGILHLGSTDSMDRASLARLAAALLGHPQALIRTRAGGVEAPGRAPRHKNGLLRVDKARALLATPLLSAEASIRRAVESRP